MSGKVYRYTVENWAESGHCSQCGAPVDIGDTMFTDVDTADDVWPNWCACSMTCAGKLAVES